VQASLDAPGPTARGATVWGAALFSMFGLCMEVVFTGLGAWWDGSFKGSVSLLMIPVYTAVYLMIGPLLATAQDFGITRPAVRVPPTVLLIYAVEWSFGASYERLGLEPWRYHHGWASDFSHGHISLYYLPAWIGFALAVVPVWKFARALGQHADAAAQRAFARTRPP
jgi:hypothetical protein